MPESLETVNPDTVPRVLPRGKHAASREVVRESQRVRLMEAMTTLAAQKGYAAVTIADLVARAGVAKPTFYEHFRDKEDCFISVYDSHNQAVTQALIDSLNPGDSTDERIRNGLMAFLRFLAADDDRARILQIESLKAGPAAVARVSEAHKRYASVYIASREEVRAMEPEVPPISTTRGLAIVGAVNEPICMLLRERHASSLLDIADELIVVVEALAHAQ